MSQSGCLEVWHFDTRPQLRLLALSQEADACQMLEPPETSASAPHVEDDDAVLPVSTQGK